MIIRYKESFKSRFNRQLRYIARNTNEYTVTDFPVTDFQSPIFITIAKRADSDVYKVANSRQGMK